MKRVRKVLYIMICILIFLCFLKLYLDVVCSNFVDQTIWGCFVKILQLLLAMALFAGIYIFLLKKKHIIEKYYWKILFCFSCFLFIIQLVIGNKLRVIPRWDFSAVYDGAVEWVVEGSFYNFYEYFYYYPNNLGELSFLTFFFRMAANLGFLDFYFVGMLLNSLMSILLVITTSLICKKIFSPTEAVLSLIIYGLCPPMYLMASVFYSDQLTMVFPVLLIFLCLYYIDKNRSFKKTELLALSIAVIGFIGYYIKPTVFIVIIAIFIMLALEGQWKRLLLLFINVGLVFTVLTITMNTYFYTNHLDKEIAEKQNTPMELWIYMGLNENLGFSGDDTEFARAIEDPKLRKEILREKIIERIEDYGVSGMYKHLKRKGVMVFADGTFELSYTFLFGFVKENSWGNILTAVGDSYSSYWWGCSLVWYSVLLLGIIGEGILCVEKLRKDTWKASYDMIKKQKNSLLFAVSLSLFGLWLFLMLWEVHCRYTVNYYGLFVIMAIGGLGRLRGLLKTDRWGDYTI